MVIKSIKKTKSGYRLVMDTGESFLLTDEGFHALGKKEGQVIKDEESIEKILRSDRFPLLKHKAMMWLSLGARTKKQIQLKYSKEGFTKDEVSRLIVFLENYNLIDEEEHLKRSIESLQSKKTSKSKTRFILFQKGFDKELASEAMENWDLDAERKNALELAGKKWKSIKDRKEEFHKKKEKLIRYLVARGFSWNVISGVLEEMKLKNEDDLFLE